jgi:hypothetical protein
MEQVNTDQMMSKSTYVSKEDAAFLKHLGLVVVVDSVVREENLVLVRGICTAQFLLRFHCAQATFENDSPEGSVVEVVDVACISQLASLRGTRADSQSACRQQ